MCTREVKTLSHDINKQTLPSLSHEGPSDNTGSGVDNVCGAANTSSVSSALPQAGVHCDPAYMAVGHMKQDAVRVDSESMDMYPP